MKIAICGIRGVPACYGGFETFAEELGKRLVLKGHQVSVYGRKHFIKYRESKYLGIDIRLLPSIRHKYLETPVHTCLCLIDICFRNFDAVLVCNAANSPFLILPRVRALPVAVNVDGIERMRGKWNRLGKLWYLLGEYCSVKLANRVVSDAEVIAKYYRETYSCLTEVITYGHREMPDEMLVAKTASGDFSAFSGDIYSELGILPGKYILYVSRLEPENNAHLVIEAYEMASDEVKRFPLVIVGDAPYSDSYKAKLRQRAGSSVKFAGFRFGDSYVQLQLGAYLYLQATEVGGTHPALVEAMGFGNCIIANGTPENIEVLSSAGLIYQKNSVADLGRNLQEMCSHPEIAKKFRIEARKRAKEFYNWDKITSDYERLFASMCA